MWIEIGLAPAATGATLRGGFAVTPTNHGQSSARPPDVQWRQCTRKVRHASPARAQAELIRLWLDGRGTHLHVYACQLVQPVHWHVGHAGCASDGEDA